MNERLLNVNGKGRGEPLQVELLGFKSAWLNKYLMALFFGKSDYFILNARAVARADALYCAPEQGRAVEIFGYDAFCFVVCVGDVAGEKVFRGSVAIK